MAVHRIHRSITRSTSAKRISAIRWWSPSANAVLARFPPTLIITSTRDIALSPAVYTHTQLVKLGVDAQLHVWEAMVHGFFGIHPELPESREAWDVIVKFFDSRLGT